MRPIVMGCGALTALAAALGFGLALAGCRRAVAETRVQAQTPVISVQAATATLRPMPRYLMLTGTLVPNQRAEVAADVAGKVRATYVERGSVVRAGAPLASVDSRTAALTRAEATAQAKALDAQHELAKTECERAERLYRDEVLSKAEHDRQAAQCEVSQFSTEAAQARVDLAGKVVGDSIIRAPFSGLVGERLVATGEYVRPDSRIVTLVDIDTMRLELSVPETAVASVHVGQTVRFRVASFGTEEFSAIVKYLGPALRTMSRDLLAEASFDNTAHNLKPGMFATARLEIARTDTPVVPKTALRDEGSSHHLFVINQKRLEERVVETGAEEADLVAIAMGVSPGEKVVAKVTDPIKDGLAVEAND